MIMPQQTDDVTDEVVAGVDVDDVPVADVEPTLPSLTPTTQSPPPSQELPSTLQVVPTPPPSPIAKPSSPPQQQKPSQPTHDAEISLDLIHTLLETCTTLTKREGIIADIDADKDVTLEEVAAKDAEVEENADVQGRPKESQAQIYKIDIEHADKVLRMSYDDIRLIFEKYFNLNVAFLEKPKEQLEEEESRALKRKTKSS
nr:hypothetical protein [Tanacetum cinerariifolium]